MIQIEEDLIRHLGTVLNNSKKVLIMGHRNPDGDAIGSILGLNEVLTQRGKMCDLTTVDKVPKALLFLPCAEKIKHEFSIHNYDSIIICDSGAKPMTGFLESHPELFDNSTGIPVINIDHHSSNDNYGTINIVDPLAASTTIIITEILLKLGWKISAPAATALLTGIYTDTGSFMHSNTNAFTLRIAARLLEKGANIRMIRKNIFKTTQISTLKLWGRVLENIQNKNGVTFSTVTEDDFQATKSHYSELTGIIDYVNSVPNSNFSIMLTERNGKVKGSLRTLNNNIDLSELAGQFGGGGHKKAAGFTMSGKLKKEVKWTVIPQEEKNK